MNKWRKDWRESYLPQLTKADLLALREGLLKDDPALLQGVSVFPTYTPDGKVEGGCAICYAIWKGRGVTSVKELEATFDDVLIRSVKSLVATDEHFLKWYDETPREIMRRELIVEISLNLESMTNELSPHMVPQAP